MFKKEILLNVFMLLILPAIGVIAVYAKYSEDAIYLAWVLILVGLALFAKAKISQINKGKVISFGSNGLAKIDRLSYFFGYALMGCGALMCIVFVAS